VIATKATEATKIRSIVCGIPWRGLEDEKAPGDHLPGGLSDRRDWVHPPVQRCSSRHLAPQSWSMCGKVRYSRYPILPVIDGNYFSCLVL